MRKARRSLKPIVEEESGASVSTIVKGSPEQVTRAHKKLSPDDQPIETESEPTPDKNEKFFDLLETTQGHRVLAQRRKPLHLNGKDLKNHIQIGETPLEMLDIENTIMV